MIRYMRDYLIICSEKLLQNLSILLLLHEPQSAYPSCQAEFSATLTIISLMPFLPPFSFLGVVPLFQGRLPLMLFMHFTTAGMYRCIQ